jgi:small subunit ribosomal protein S3
MGQKVSPVSMRLGVNRDFQANWYADKKDFAKFLNEDIKIRKYLETQLKEAALSKVEIQRGKNEVKLSLHVARPGVVLGQEGSNLEVLKKGLKKICAQGEEIKLNVVTVENPDLDATIVAQSIAEALENRQSFRTAQKRAIMRVMKAGAKGIKTSVSGRLGGTDIARSEGYSEGVVPLHTIRSDIDYAAAEAATTYGRLGVKVWICRGEIIPTKQVKGE